MSSIDAATRFRIGKIDCYALHASTTRKKLEPIYFVCNMFSLNISSMFVGLINMFRQVHTNGITHVPSLKLVKKDSD